VAKQSIFGRIAQLTKANINALIDSAEDPELMMDQLIRDYTDNIAEAEGAVAQTIGNLRLMEADQVEDQQAAAEWGAKAAAAAAKAQALAAEGKADESAKFESLARVALKRQIGAEQEAADVEPTLAQQREIVAKLKAGLAGMKEKLDELRRKRDELAGRAKVAQAQNQVQDALKSVDLLDPTSEISRFEEKIRREEARAAGRAELAASSLDAQFEALDDLGDDAEVEARLAALKSGG
jgi:phage shock protein A